MRQDMSGRFPKYGLLPAKTGIRRRALGRCRTSSPEACASRPIAKSRNACAARTYEWASAHPAVKLHKASAKFRSSRRRSSRMGFLSQQDPPGAGLSLSNRTFGISNTGGSMTVSAMKCLVRQKTSRGSGAKLWAFLSAFAWRSCTSECDKSIRNLNVKECGTSMPSRCTKQPAGLTWRTSIQARKSRIWVGRATKSSSPGSEPQSAWLPESRP